MAICLIGLPNAVSAQDRSREPRERDMRSQEQSRPRDDRSQRQPRASVGEVIRNVEQGRPGRRVDVNPSGDDYVVTWAYPDGRVSRIPVDGRTGRPRGN
ncbi:hypothetical protein ASG17_04280 [Brevundimonas sp. Leaf363]|nr:hypothetical protein ASG17_04280 [Brevundimonas sp. Leaf363]